MTERCSECGTPVDEVPLVDCAEHRRVHLADEAREAISIDARLVDRADRLRHLEDRIDALPDTGGSIQLKLILREMVRLLA
jgi:hypothetical protein